MNHRTAKRLHDAHRAIGHILAFTANRSLDEYRSDVYFQSAVERQFEIVAESLNVAEHDDASLRDVLPELPVVVGLRNRIAHEYDSIDHQIIWDTIQFDLPDLYKRVSALLDSHGLGGNR
ncbi:MAG: DUF86 domain-containing protein [Thermomicrobiales bacterium]|nr:DUF86 domain-containing protein [Thermomicrobiales bacterium]